MSTLSYQLWSKRFLYGAIVLLVLMLISLMVGAKWIEPKTIMAAFLSFDASNSDHLLVRQLRLPRTMVAILVGAALGAAGVILQAITRNPLADPGLLGINAGAAVAIVAAIALLGASSMLAQLWAGFIGAALAGVMVYLLGGIRHQLNLIRILLAGAALTVVLLALAQMLILNSDEHVFDQFRHWAVGSLQGRGQQVLLPVSLLISLGLLMTVYLIRALDVMSLGQDLVEVLGVNIRLVWIVTALAVIILTGTATALAGPISFVGLAAPHLARYFTGANHRLLLPFTLLLSAILVLLADILGRLVVHPDEIGVGIMIALLGGPFFILLARGKRLIQL